MHNQHAGLSQALAEQRITERHEQAAQARLVGDARPPRRRRWRLGRGWPGGQASRPTSQPTVHTAPADRSGTTMSSRARALIVGATLAAMTLAGMTAVAHAQATDEPTSKQAARRPPTQGQVGEAWHQPQEPADVPAVAGETRRSPTESQVGESWRYQTSVPGRPAESGGQLGWRIASLGFLAAALAMVGGLAVLAATRPSRGPQVGQAP